MSPRVEQSQADKDFATSLKRARTFIGWNQTIVADRMREQGFSHYTQTTVWRNESDGRTVSVGEALALVNMLGVKLQAASVLSYEDGYRAGINAARESLAALN